MSDKDAEEIHDSRMDWMVEHRAMYLRSGGAKGHIMNIEAVGGHAFTTHCMIRYVGRKSGKTYITPLIYGDIGGEIVIVASKGGADNHPAWFLNLTDSETVDVQVAAQAFRCGWRIAEGEERAKVWSFMVDLFPSYADYQASTDRELPLVMMKPIKEIEVFREEDADAAISATRQR